MWLMKIGAANVNTTVGAFRSNVDRALGIAEEMAADDVTLGVFQGCDSGRRAPRRWRGGPVLLASRDPP
jgi:NAD+ synthase (glutamine-hydrolysing)